MIATQLNCIRYDRDSSLPWMVLIHGFGGSVGMWKKQVEVFRSEFNMLLLELPGHGDSEDGIASVYDSVTFEDIAGQIIDRLHEEGISSAHFIAVSMGTLVLSSIVKLCPELVRSVILCGAVFGMGPLSKIQFRLGNLIKRLLPYMTVVKLMATILMPKKSHALSRKFLVRECRKLGREEFLRWYGLAVREIDRLCEDITLFQGIDSLVVMGSEDHVFLKRATQTVQEVAGSVHLKVMENCGHVCNLQNAGEFNHIAKRFFDFVSNKGLPAS